MHQLHNTNQWLESIKESAFSLAQDDNGWRASENLKTTMAGYRESAIEEGTITGQDEFGFLPVHVICI